MSHVLADSPTTIPRAVLADKVVGRIDRTDMSGPVCVSAFFGMMNPVFSWWGLAAVSVDPVLAKRDEDADAADVSGGVTRAIETQTKRMQRFQTLDMLSSARILDNFEGGLLLHLNLGDAPLDPEDAGSKGAWDCPALIHGGSAARTILIGQDVFQNVPHHEYHCMTTEHRFAVFETCDALAAHGLRLHLVVETIPAMKLIEVPTRAEYDAIEAARNTREAASAADASAASVALLPASAAGSKRSRDEPKDEDS